MEKKDYCMEKCKEKMSTAFCIFGEKWMLDGLVNSNH